jgi:hypothetical protein
MFWTVEIPFKTGFTAFAMQFEKTFMILLCDCLQLTFKFVGFTHVIVGGLENVILLGRAMIEWLKHTDLTNTHRLAFPRDASWIHADEVAPG